MGVRIPPGVRGKSMKFQQLAYSCGPASIVNALRCFGIRKAEKTIRKTSNTNPKNGTSEEDMIRVLTDLGFRVNKHEQGNFTKAWKWLHTQVREGHPIIISVRNWSHYVAVIGSIGDRIIIADPDGASHKKENGILVLNKRRLKKFWYHTTEKLYTGLAIEK